MLPHPSGTEPPPSLPPSTHSSSQTSTTRSSTTWPSWAVRTTSSSTSAVPHPSGRREQTSNRRTTILSHHRRAEAKARYPTNSFRSNYDYYDSSRYSGDYLYPVQHQVSHPVSCLLGHQSFWRKIWIFQFILFRKYDRNGLEFFYGWNLRNFNIFWLFIRKDRMTFWGFLVRILQPCLTETFQVMGNWKHYNLSSQTLNERNQRATSPLVSRELTR